MQPSNRIYHMSTLLGAIPRLSHGFFGRNGGVSEGIYASLNCGPGSKDKGDHVQKNYQAAMDAFGVNLEDLYTLKQVHGDGVHVVQSVSEDRGMWPFVRPEGDALVTNTPGVAIGIMTADCTPILFADPEARVIAAAHAGWRGVLRGIIEETVRSMVTLGAHAERIHVAIGPCIHQKNYEVGPDVHRAVLSKDPDAFVYFKCADGNGKHYLNLPGFCASILRSLSVASIHDLMLDTYASEDAFFSCRRAHHRSEPDYGRQLSCIMLQT